MKKSFSFNSTILFVLAIASACGFSVLLVKLFHTHQSNERNRTALLHFSNSLKIGDSHFEVLSAYWGHRTDDLRIFVEGSDFWLVRMPRELGTSEWILFIEFVNNKVSKLRVRTTDGLPPKNGPNDK